MPATKTRSLGKCREWERERRTRFNDACTQLGELVKQHPVDDTMDGKNRGNLAKIEIIVSAITLIQNLLRDKLQLDANLHAAQAKLQSIMDTFNNRKDASTQINREIQSTTKGSKKKKVYWKEIVRHGKCSLNNQKEHTKPELRKAAAAPQLFKLLPKSKTIEKKVTEKAVVILPAAPYILPRSILLPPTPPTFVLLQPSSRNNIPIMSRVVSEITKTTMVNNLPITAYSYPLSLAKNKKTKLVSETKKPIPPSHKRQSKFVKKIKNLANKKKSDVKTTTPNKLAADDDSDTVANVDRKSESQTVNTPVQEDVAKESPDKKEEDSVKEVVEKIHIIENKIKKIDASKSVTPNKTIQPPKETKEEKNVKQQESLKCDRIETLKETHSSLVCQNNISINQKNSIEANEKNKVDKIPQILDANLCDNTADGGNARLELAEEFLAASPTAAFLMTFPLVSGMRAETPPDYEPSSIQTSSRPIFNHNIAQKRDQISSETPHSHAFFGKSSEMSKQHKIENNTTFIPNFSDKPKQPDKPSFHKSVDINQMLAVTSSSGTEHSFLSIHAPSVLTTTTAPADTTFSLDFETTFSKNTNTSQAYVTSNNFIFKNDPLNSMKNNNLNMYSTNNISGSHDFNAFGLYPCAVEKYSNKMHKSDYTNTDDNFMKIGSSRVTYDLDLGLPQKPYDMMNTASNVNNLNKENIFTPVTTTFSSSSYNPFNPEFHMPLVTSSASSSSLKKTNNKSNIFYTDTITNLYSQPSTLWPEEINMYGNNNVTKPPVKQQSYPSYSNQSVTTTRYSSSNNVVENKTQINHINVPKSSKLEINQLVQEKITKKPPSKTHINWMTSEIRPLQNNSYDSVYPESKDMSRIQYTSASSALGHFDYNASKKQDYIEPNFFPISMPNLSSQSNQDDIQLWPPTRPLGTTEICLDPPPINLPTLVGDLALGPHERRKSVDRVNRGLMQPEQSNCNNFLSVTQLMNRSSDNIPTGRVQGISNENQKPVAPKYDNLFTYPNTFNDKPLLSHINTNSMQPCYFFNDPKQANVMENLPNQTKTRSHKPAEKTNKSHKNNYSAEALLKGANSAHKLSDNFSTMKFVSQKYPEYNPSHDGQVAQVSHFPGLADYPDNNYSSASLYNSTTNTVSNSFYSNFMPGTTGIISTNYNTCNFTGDFIEYTPSSDCNFTYPRFDSFKIKNHDPSGHTKFSLDLNKSIQKDLLGKHKVECSKKDLSKNKYQSKRPKMNVEVEDWSQVPGPMLHNKNVNKKYTSLMSEDMTFSNCVVNQGPTHSHNMPDILNCPLGGSSHAAVGAALSRPHNSCPSNATRTNFNLSTLFPEIAKKVQ